jgi:hypothetical protein
MLQVRHFGGLDVSVPQDKIEDHRSPDCSNVHIVDGALTSRNGFQRLYPVVQTINGKHHKIRGLYVYRKANGATYRMIAHGTKMLVHTSFLATLSASVSEADWSFETYKDTCLAIQGGTPFKYDGTTWAAVGGTPPSGDTIVQHMERVYIMNSGTDVVRYSDTDDYETWQSINSLKVHPQDGDNIVTGVSRGFELVVFKERHIYEIRGGATPKQVVPIDGSIGTVAAKSVVKSPYGVFFLSRSGPRLLDGQFVEYKFAEAVDPLFRYNPSRLATASAMFYDNKYVLAYSDGTVPYNNKVLEYDCKEKEWFMFDGIHCGDFGILNPELDEDQAYFGDSEKGMVYKWDTGSKDDDRTISWWWTSKAFDFGHPMYQKKLRRLAAHAHAASGEMSVGFATLLTNDFHTNQLSLVNPYSLPSQDPDDYGVARWDEGYWDEFVWGFIPSNDKEDTIRVQDVWKMAGARGYWGRFKFAGNDPTTVYSFEVEYKIKQKMR